MNLNRFSRGAVTLCSDLPRDAVLLVDSSMYPSDARAVVSEIRKLTPKPVRYLVNTHWHDD